MTKIRGFLWTVFFLFPVSCSLTEIRQQEFKNIKKGMTKSEVLGVAGDPHWSDRKNGKDRWFYYIDPHNRRTEKVVYFKKNRVIGKGYRNQPSPEETDSKLPGKSSGHPGSKEPIPSEQELRELIKEEIKKKSKPVKFEKI